MVSGLLEWFSPDGGSALCFRSMFAIECRSLLVDVVRPHSERDKNN